MEKLRKRHSKSNRYVLGSVTFSIILHAVILFVNVSKDIVAVSKSNDSTLNILNLQNLNITPPSNLKIKNLKVPTKVITKKKTKPEMSRPIDKLSLMNPTINEFLSADNLISGSSDKIDNSSAQFKIELPPGLVLDELNEAQLVLYNFRVRTAKQYFNSFYSQLRDFSTSKPHLKFPMTETKERMTVKVTYDTDGNVMKIKMVRVTNKAHLQEFFEELAKKMHTLSNPPDMIVHNGEFSLYYSLNIY